MRLTLLSAVAAQLSALVAAASLRINIPASTLLPNPNALPASTHATLSSSDGSELKASIRKGNFIDFESIPTVGTHLLNIYTRDYVVAPYRIDVALSPTDPSTTEITGAFETYRGTQWSDHGVALTSGGRPTQSLTMNAKVLSRKNFYETRQGFNVLSLLKNPMILMGGVALLFTFGMPKLMENMDPEMRAEYEEMQKKSPMVGIGKAMQGGGGGSDGFDLAGYLAGNQGTEGSGASKGSGGSGIRERKR
jgi:ER membrane protein complex subunit 7